MLYPVELRAQNLIFTYENPIDHLHVFMFMVANFFLVPPRRPGGPYYIHFEPPSNYRAPA